jgi:hypothetical protein
MLHINVNEHTEKKGQLTYLSWAWAWAEALKEDPQATWEVVEYPQEDGTLQPCMYLRNGTAMVKVKATVKGVTRACHLPVMDHKNKAIPNPDAFHVNTAIMRAMTKALAMHGLGLYIYAGEDLPQAAAPESDADKDQREAWERRQAELDELALVMIDNHRAGNDAKAIDLWYSPGTWADAHEQEQEERLYVWGLLRENSKLRAVIKANKPA